MYILGIFGGSFQVSSSGTSVSAINIRVSGIKELNEETYKASPISISSSYPTNRVSSAVKIS
jgi:hypothetical protein